MSLFDGYITTCITIVFLNIMLEAESIFFLRLASLNFTIFKYLYIFHVKFSEKQKSTNNIVVYHGCLKQSHCQKYFYINQIITKYETTIALSSILPLASKMRVLDNLIYNNANTTNQNVQNREHLIGTYKFIKRFKRFKYLFYINVHK